MTEMLVGVQGAESMAPITANVTRRDVCSYIIESSFVTSYYFGRRFAIHLRNIHLPAGMKNKMNWWWAVNFSMLEAPLMSVRDGLKAWRNRQHQKSKFYPPWPYEDICWEAEGCRLPEWCWLQMWWVSEAQRLWGQVDYSAGFIPSPTWPQRKKQNHDKIQCSHELFKLLEYLNSWDRIVVFGIRICWIFNFRVVLDYSNS